MSVPENELLTVIPGKNFISYEQMNTIFSITKLWIDLSYWIRDLAISTYFDLPNLQATTNQVINVMPLNFYNSLRLFYGPELAQLFLNYITDFLASMLQLVNAYKINDTAAVDSSTVQLYHRANVLSEFLSHINIYWDINQWKFLCSQYIKLSINQVITSHNNNNDLGMNLFYKIQDLSVIMGNYMARGVVVDKSLIKPQFFFQK